jgi:UDP-N-acetylmuramoyl-tripeptide--D-alanyl-D-alanine ligase
MHTTLDELYNIFIKHRTISTDSRQIPDGCLFFALKGENFNGNLYAKAAIENGAAYAVIDDSSFDGNQTLLVDDVLTTLQQLALMHRRKHNIPVLAITGSNGKTTAKELINAVLSRKYRVTATRGNLNNHIGVPLTLLGITTDTELAIIEMGANHQGEISQLCTFAEPTHGMITNIGKAHLEGFGGYQGVIKAKSELYAWLRDSGGKVFVNAGNELLMELTTGMNRVLYGSEQNAYCRGTVGTGSEMLFINWHSGADIIPVSTNLVGSYNFENAMAAICIGMFFEVPSEKVHSAISEYLPSNSRSQAMKTAKNSIILDAYNANPTSMQAAINNFSQVKADHKMVILGDMLELGEESPAEHHAIIDLVQKSAFEKAIFVGPEFKKAVGNQFISFLNSAEAYQNLLEQKTEGYTILIKGSRGIQMEKVLEAL